MNLVRRVQTLEQRMLAMKTVMATPTTLDAAAAVLALLEEQVNQVRADPLADPTERARPSACSPGWPCGRWTAGTSTHGPRQWSAC